MEKIRIKTHLKREVIDITGRTDTIIHGIREGLLHLWLAHTTAAITTADLDPGTDEDMLEALESLLPKKTWRHPHNPEHAPDHIISSIIGPTLTIPIEKGKLTLGTWQRVVLVELDGPREREILAMVQGE